MSVFNYEKDQDGIVTVTMDMTGPVNAMNDEYKQAMNETVGKLEQEDGLTGVVIASAKKVFFAGGDIKDMIQAKPEDSPQIFQNCEAIKADLRRLEKLPVPVVAAINGAALGGGYEISLGCNYRIAFNHKSVQIGLPETGLGLFPGGGGVVRLTKLIGLEKALPMILEAKRLTPEKALAAGMIDQLVGSLEELVPAAKAWILENKDSPEAAAQPWDRKGYRIPGGAVNSPKNAQLAVMAPTMLHQKTRGLMPHATAAMDVAFQATMLDVDTALRIEGREFAKIMPSAVAKNMITAFFFNLGAINAGQSRPKGVEKSPTRKVGILGAGMMGQGIAYVSAMSGIEVVLKDISQDAADKGKAYSEALLAKRVKRGQMTEEKAAGILSLINATAENEDLTGCDLIIEAVFENIELKHKITAELEGHLSDDGFWGSNTSTLPITKLAEGASKPENFIGIHFFSPVDKMPLVEIICGDKTSDEALAKAFDFVMQIRKTPIVVNDSLGFFTSRTFGTYLDEGGRMVHEGLHPYQIDNIGKAIGMPVGPLTINDETSMELARKVMETWESMGIKDQWGEQTIIRELVEFLVVENGRGGRHHGGGYYEYPNGQRGEVWQGVLDKYYKPEVSVPEQDMKDRLLFRPVIETLKCLETNVLRSVADGNIGSIFGIGAPAHTGGYIQFVNTYGLDNFMARCAELSGRYGDRFNCPQIVKDKAAAGEIFS